MCAEKPKRTALMQSTSFGARLLAIAALVWGMPNPSVGQECTHCCPGGPWGDGADGNLVVDADTVISLEAGDKNYQNLTVAKGVTLTIWSYGNTLRVCGILRNMGTIAEEPGSAGSDGGSGGASWPPAIPLTTWTTTGSTSKPLAWPTRAN